KDTRGIAAAYCNYHTIENVNGISGNDLCARSTQRHIGNEVHCAVTPRRIKLQGCVGRQQTIADGEHAIVSQRRHFDDIGMRINAMLPPRALRRLNLAEPLSEEETSIRELTATESLVEVRFTVPPLPCGEKGDCT